MRKKIVIGVGVVLVILVGVAFWYDVPRFVIGIMTYGQQAREGSLKVGDAAPVVAVYELDGETQRPLADYAGAKPLVLIFGSFT